MSTASLADAHPGDVLVRHDGATGEVAFVGLAQVWATWEDARPFAPRPVNSREVARVIPFPRRYAAAVMGE